MAFKENYGKSLKNPVQLNSIPASVIFMNNLVTYQGYHIFYHRIGSVPNKSKPVDHYEIMTSDNRYDDIFIDVYNDLSVWIPPKGYLFENPYIIMNRQLRKFSKRDELDIHDIILFDDKFLYPEIFHRDFKPEDYIEAGKSLPFLEKVTFESFGTNLWSDGFPFPVLLEYFIYVCEYPEAEVERLISAVVPRGANNQDRFEPPGSL